MYFRLTCLQLQETHMSGSLKEANKPSICVGIKKATDQLAVQKGNHISYSFVVL